MQASFNNTVQVLVKSYINGTLGKGTCFACAVGNICAVAAGTAVTEMLGWAEGAPLWPQVFVTPRFEKEQFINEKAYEAGVKVQIDSTGYSWGELARIESAFEGAYPGGYYGDHNADAASYAGLMAVVDVLAEIHGIDLATAEVAKGLFVRA